MLDNELDQGDILSGVRFGLALLAYADILLCSTWAIHRIRQTPVNCSSPSRRFADTLIRDYGRLTGLPVEAHPHMLCHACGFALAYQGADTRLIQDYLGHRNIQHTVRYTATNPARFERLWR